MLSQHQLTSQEPSILKTAINSKMILRLVASLLVLIAAVSAASSTVTVYAWPLSATSPKPYAEVYLPSSSNELPTVRSRTNPQVTDGELVRIGLLDDSKSWSGVATSADSFKTGINQKLILHTDGKGQVTHVGFTSFKSEKGRKEGVLELEVESVQDGPLPSLNKPVVLNAEGKLEKPGEKDERSFLQKYVHVPNRSDSYVTNSEQVLVGDRIVPSPTTRRWGCEGVGTRQGREMKDAYLLRQDPSDLRCRSME